MVFIHKTVSTWTFQQTLVTAPTATAWSDRVVKWIIPTISKFKSTWVLWSSVEYKTYKNECNQYRNSVMLRFYKYVCNVSMYIFYAILFRQWSDVKIRPVLLQPPYQPLMIHEYAAFVAWQPIMRENWNSWRETCPSVSLAINCLSYGTAFFMQKDILQNKGNIADSPCTLYSDMITKAKWSSEFKW